MLIMEYLKKEAALTHELRENVIFGRLLKRAGFVSAAEQSDAKVKRASPMATDAPVEIPRVFHVLKGASSSYCPSMS